MSTSTKAVRVLLRKHPAGMTVRQLADATGYAPNGLHVVMRGMPDAYILKYVQEGCRRMSAVWAVVVPPPNCPPPKTGRVNQFSEIREQVARMLQQPLTFRTISQTSTIRPRHAKRM